MVGRTLGRYHIVEQLGAGGMGAVYRAHDERLHRDVAIKVLNAATFADDEAKSRFRREALALSRLNHPNVASIYDFESFDGQDLLIMELVPGDTLVQKLKDGPLPEKEILVLGRQLMQGLAASHEAGIIHRDLKPANIRVTPDGRLKILDFGLAKEVGPVADVDEITRLATSVGRIVGTVPYMAPEQLLAGTVDQRTDVYGAGAVLYEMATGRRPFPEDSSALLVNDILNHEPVAPRSVNPRISQGLEQVVLKALEKEPDYRYQTAHEIAVDFDRLARTSTASGGQASPVARIRHLRGRKFAFGLSAGTAAAIGVTLFLVLSNRPALSFAAHDWIFLSSFENTTGDPVFDKSLDTAFRVCLEQSSYANVFSQSRTSAVLKRMGKENLDQVDARVGREICEREGLKGLVVPSIGQVGNQYSITSRLVNPATGDTVRSYAVTASGKDGVLAAVDSVAGKLRRGLGETLAAMEQSTAPLPKVTTASLDALKAHVDARTRQQKGDYQTAVRLFGQALQLDPDFALAHAGLGGLLMSHIFNDSVGGRRHLELAMKLRDRVTPRERLVIEVNYHSVLRHTDEALRAYRVYLASWPDDSAMRANFGTLLRNSDRVSEAVEQYRYAIKIDPSSAAAHVNLATCYKLLGRFTEALASWDKAFSLEPTWIVNSNLNHEYGFTLVSNGDMAKARDVFQRAIDDKNLQAAGLRSAGLLDLYEGKYRAAESRLREAIVVNKATNSRLNETRNHLFLAMTLAGRDDRAGAVRELDAAVTLRDEKSPQAWLWARIGVSYARLGLLPKAEALLSVVRAETAADTISQVATLHWMEGELELAQAKVAAAGEKVELADKEAHTPMAQEARARVFQARGDAPRAIAVYEDLLNRSASECLGWEPQFACVAARYELAALYRADRRPDKARRQLDEFLSLWKSADEDLPLLRRAKSLKAAVDKEQ
jgi:eukaryotic-like serine/threonine-protein kinase